MKNCQDLRRPELLHRQILSILTDSGVLRDQPLDGKGKAGSVTPGNYENELSFLHILRATLPSLPTTSKSFPKIFTFTSQDTR